jgi:hypothetical protein
MLCTTTSTVGSRRLIAATPAGCFRSMHSDRLLRLMARKIELMPRPRVTPLVRMRSPSGASTLITSAP